MCVAVPVLVVTVEERQGLSRPAVVSTPDGQTHEIDLALLDGVGVGDYVIAHSGYAISRLEPEQASEIVGLLTESREETANQG